MTEEKSMLKKDEKSKRSMRALFYDNADMLFEAFESMSEAVIAFSHEDYDKANEKSQETIQIEKKLDRLRDELVQKIFSKETMVFSRPDRLHLAESMDKICDEIEIVVRKMMQHTLELPPNIGTGLEEMANKVIPLGEAIKNLIKAVLEDFSKGDQFIQQITDIRREIRDIHWELLRKNYDNKPDPLDFFYVYNLVKAISMVADKTEEFSDQVHGLLCKYAL